MVGGKTAQCTLQNPGRGFATRQSFRSKILGWERGNLARATDMSCVQRGVQEVHIGHPLAWLVGWLVGGKKHCRVAKPRPGFCNATIFSVQNTGLGAWQPCNSDRHDMRAARGSGGAHQSSFGFVGWLVGRWEKRLSRSKTPAGVLQRDNLFGTKYWTGIVATLQERQTCHVCGESFRRCTSVIVWLGWLVS